MNVDNLDYFECVKFDGHVHFFVLDLFSYFFPFGSLLAKTWSQWLFLFLLKDKRSQANNCCVRNLSLILISLVISSGTVFVQTVICYWSKRLRTLRPSCFGCFWIQNSCSCSFRRKERVHCSAFLHTWLHIHSASFAIWKLWRDISS